MYDNKKIFIFGMARSGYEVAKLLNDVTKELFIIDAKDQDENHIKELENLGIKVIIDNEQDKYLDETFDYVVKNPGIKLDNPLILKAKKLNIPVINEVEVAYHFLPKNIDIVGVCGSNGKTTTTTLTYEFLKKGNRKVHLGGNIGIPLSALVKDVNENDILVLEISGHQLHDMHDFKTNVSILTNLTEVHLDHFGTFENYKYYKSQIFRNHTEEDVAIINGNDSNVLEVANNFKSRKITFSSVIKADLYIENEAIYYNNDKIVDLKDIKIKGNHNYENIMCAIAASKHYGITNEQIKEVVSTFNGVEHRIEYVDTINGRSFYNDSKATNVKSTQIALNAFNESTILILGGLDRKHPFDGLLPYMKNVTNVVCYGETKNRIKEFCDTNHFNCEVLNNLEEATKKAYELSKEGDVILLSPACASWDQYDSFEVRGDEFKNTIYNLKNKNINLEKT